MSGDKYALLIMVVIAAALAANGYRTRNRKEDETSHDDQIFRTAPRWAGRMHEQLNTVDEKLNTVLAGQRRLHQHIGSAADADEKRDTEMSAETQAAIDELKDEVAQNTDATASVVAVIDGLIERFEAAGNDPAEIRAEIAAMKTNRDALAAAALKGTPIDPSAN